MDGWSNAADKFEAKFAGIGLSKDTEREVEELLAAANDEASLNLQIGSHRTNAGGGLLGGSHELGLLTTATLLAGDNKEAGAAGDEHAALGHDLASRLARLKGRPPSGVQAGPQQQPLAAAAAAAAATLTATAAAAPGGGSGRSRDVRASPDDEDIIGASLASRLQALKSSTPAGALGERQEAPPSLRAVPLLGRHGGTGGGRRGAKLQAGTEDQEMGESHRDGDGGGGGDGDGDVGGDNDGTGLSAGGSGALGTGGLGGRARRKGGAGGLERSLDDNDDDGDGDNDGDAYDVAGGAYHTQTHSKPEAISIRPARAPVAARGGAPKGARRGPGGKSVGSAGGAWKLPPRAKPTGRGSTDSEADGGGGRAARRRSLCSGDEGAQEVDPREVESLVASMTDELRLDRQWSRTHSAVSGSGYLNEGELDSGSEGSEGRDSDDDEVSADGDEVEQMVNWARNAAALDAKFGAEEDEDDEEGEEEEEAPARPREGVPELPPGKNSYRHGKAPAADETEPGYLPDDEGTRRGKLIGQKRK
eukprot:jgi/Mesen1/9543/ME000064S08892